jgi:ankyrin repeat protein
MSVMRNVVFTMLGLFTIITCHSQESISNHFKDLSVKESNRLLEIVKEDDPEKLLKFLKKTQMKISDYFFYESRDELSKESTLLEINILQPTIGYKAENIRKLILDSLENHPNRLQYLNSCLTLIVNEKDYQLFDEFISMGCNINEMCVLCGGVSPLGKALMMGDATFVEKILGHGASTTMAATEDEEITLADAAIQGDLIEYYRQFVNYSRNDYPNEESIISLFDDACGSENDFYLRDLVKNFNWLVDSQEELAQILFSEYDNWSPLMSALYTVNNKTFMYIQNETDVFKNKERLAEHTFSDGSTLLHEAMYSEKYDIFKWMLAEFPFDLNYLDLEGYCYLSTAAGLDDIEFVKLILNSGRYDWPLNEWPAKNTRSKEIKKLIQEAYQNHVKK